MISFEPAFSPNFSVLCRKNTRIKIFLTFTERVEFRIILSFEQHQNCNFWFKINGNFRGHHVNIELMED